VLSKLEDAIEEVDRNLLSSQQHRKPSKHMAKTPDATMTVLSCSIWLNRKRMVSISH